MNINQNYNIMKNEAPIVFLLKNDKDKPITVDLFDKDADITSHPIVNITYKEIVDEIKEFKMEVQRLELVSNNYCLLPSELPITIIQEEDNGVRTSSPYYGLTNWEGINSCCMKGHAPESSIIKERTIWKILLPPLANFYLRIYPLKK